MRSQKVLKPSIKNGYKSVQLYNNISYKYISIHRIIAFTYIKNPQNKQIVNHKNGNKLDNNVINLEWSTQKENINHALKQNLIKPYQRKVYQYQNGNIINTFNSIKYAAISINLSRDSVAKVCIGQNKTAGGYEWKYVTPNKQFNINKFKDIPNYPYKVSKNGDIYGNRNKKLLKPMKNANGYHYVTLCKNKQKKNQYVHQLVAQTYIKNKENKKIVNHKNGNKTDNKIKNLEWVTQSENVQHYYDTLK